MNYKLCKMNNMKDQSLLYILHYIYCTQMNINEQNTVIIKQKYPFWYHMILIISVS